MRVFSYRVDQTNPRELYRARGSRDAHLKQLARKAAKKLVRFVAVADIADFYPGIYQHRLENVIETAATTDRVRDVARVLVKKLIGNIMGKNSFGIPVGPYASRVLAEALLIDVDAFLHRDKMDFVRWVDDYNIFCTTEYQAQSVLFALGEWIFSNHGLTLQAAKTKVLTIDQFRKQLLTSPEDQVTDRDTVVSMLRDFQVGYDDDEIEQPDEKKVEALLMLLQGKDLHSMLKKSLGDKALVDYQAVTYALAKLPKIPGVSAKLKRRVLSLVINNAELLYPPVSDVVRLARARGRRIRLDWSAKRWAEEHNRLSRAATLQCLARENVQYNVAAYEAHLPKGFPGYLIRSSRRLGMEA